MTTLYDLPGLQSARRIVRRLYRNDSVHALLLYGSEGAGQDELAQDLVRAWLCTQPTENGACGECQSCGAFSRHNHADFEHVVPFGEGGFIRKGGITFDPTLKPPAPYKPVRDFGRTGPLYGRHKVVWIDPVEALTSDAANSLLKILEEPQPYLKFVLSTSTVSRVLPTILSRCLAVACELPTRADVQTHMGSLADVAAVTPQLLERFSGDRSGYDRMVQFAKELGRRPGAALAEAETLRALCIDIAPEGEKEREAVRRGLELLATLVNIEQPDRPEWTQQVLEAHRRISGNVSSRVVLDALMTGIR